MQTGQIYNNVNKSRTYHYICTFASAQAVTGSDSIRQIWIIFGVMWLKHQVAVCRIPASHNIVPWCKIKIKKYSILGKNTIILIYHRNFAMLKRQKTSEIFASQHQYFHIDFRKLKISRLKWIKTRSR